MRKLILAAGALVALSGCGPSFQQSMRAAEEQRQYDDMAQQALVARVQALPASAKLECQLQGQQASASASNPRALIDLTAGAYGVQAQDTCLRMKVAQVDEQRAASSSVVRSAQVRRTAYAGRGPNEPAPLSNGRPWYCGMPDMANTRIMVECQ